MYVGPCGRSRHYPQTENRSRSQHVRRADGTCPFPFIVMHSFLFLLFILSNVCVRVGVFVFSQISFFFFSLSCFSPIHSVLTAFLFPNYWAGVEWRAKDALGAAVDFPRVRLQLFHHWLLPVLAHSCIAILCLTRYTIKLLRGERTRRSIRRLRRLPAATFL